jgi:hypothetical protein
MWRKPAYGSGDADDGRAGPNGTHVGKNVLARKCVFGDGRRIGSVQDGDGQVRCKMLCVNRMRENNDEDCGLDDGHGSPSPYISGPRLFPTQSDRRMMMA